MNIDFNKLRTADACITLNNSLNIISEPSIRYKTIEFEEVTNKKYLIEVQGYGFFGIYDTKEKAEERAKIITEKNNLICYITEIESEE